MTSDRDPQSFNAVPNEEEIREKVRETVRDLDVEDPKSRQAVEEWLFQKLLHLKKDGGVPDKSRALGIILGATQLQKTGLPSGARPMSRHRLPLNFHPEYTQAEFAKISYGLSPVSLQDKWLIALVGQDLFFYRTGAQLCVYTMHFVPSAQGQRAAETWVDQAFIEQNAWNSPAYAERLLEYLVQRLLLSRLVKFPYPPMLRKSLDRHMLQLSLVGDALANDEHRS